MQKNLLKHDRYLKRSSVFVCVCVKKEALKPLSHSVAARKSGYYFPLRDESVSLAAVHVCVLACLRVVGTGRSH